MSKITTVTIAKYQKELKFLGLDTIEKIRTFQQGEVIKCHRNNRRDIVRVKTQKENGEPLVLYIKRNWNPYKKNGIMTRITCGTVKSDSRLEWEHFQLLTKADISIPECIAYGEICGALWEYFSFIITKEATGEQTLYTFCDTCQDRNARRIVFSCLAGKVKKMHETGLTSPDLFARHIFIHFENKSPDFCFIDMARVNQVKFCTNKLAARDLAVLHGSLPLNIISIKERIQFLKDYSPDNYKKIIYFIRQRMKKLLKRSQFRRFYN